MKKCRAAHFIRGLLRCQPFINADKWVVSEALWSSVKGMRTFTRGLPKRDARNQEQILILYVYFDPIFHSLTEVCSCCTWAISSPLPLDSVDLHRHHQLHDPNFFEDQSIQIKLNGDEWLRGPKRGYITRPSLLHTVWTAELSSTLQTRLFYRLARAPTGRANTIY